MVLVQFYRKLVDQFIAPLESLLLLILRISLGYVFFRSGLGKFQSLEGVIGFFTELGLPYPEMMAPFVAGTELVCGLLILVGLLTRLASFPMIMTMVVAILTAKRAEIETASDFFALSEYLLALGLLVLVVRGAGQFSADYILKKKLARH